MTTNSTITPELLDQLLANYEKPEDLTGDDGLFKQLKKALIERALGAELTGHLGYEKGDPAGRGTGNSRNGSSSKTILTEDGEIDISVPRDRACSFEPQLIAKGQTHFDGFDDRILSLYARGMTVREIQGHLLELYGTEVSPDLISRVTDAVLDEVRDWQNRPLDPVYPVVFFDALRVKIRDEGLVKNKAVYVALALNPDGEKDVLGLWIEQTEGAKFWLKVINELKARGVNDILIAVVDGLKGFPEAITTVFPQTTVQTCIVHLIRNSLAFVSWKDRKAILPAIKAIYRAETADAALVRLEEFEAEWGKRYPAIGQAWRRAWDYVVPFFAFAPGIRKMIYTTNAVEALHRSLRKIIKTRGSFPNDDAALKLLYLAIKNAGLRLRSVILDGEAVCCDQNGLPSFDRLRHRHHDGSVFLYAFDLIELSGNDLRREPLEVRKATLASVLARAAPGLKLNEHIEADGPTVSAHACKMGLEGIVSKRKGSTYRSGRSRDWLKSKNPACAAAKREAEENW